MIDILVSGDTLDFLTPLADYPQSGGWTLKHRLVPRFSTPAQTPIEITSSSFDGTSYRTQVAPAVTATWVAGDYSWASWVEKTGARQQVDSGLVTIKPDPATLTQGHDGRSEARQVYDGLMALWVAHSTTGRALTAEYTIAGRSMRFHGTADLLKQLQYWKGQVDSEERAEKLGKGLDSGATLRVRF